MISLGLMTGVSWLTVAKQRAYRVWSCDRTQADWKWYRVIRHHAQLVYVDAKSAFLLKGANYS